ncbi:iron-siderophore ABC transporter substrate-binding protein [Ornithinimicrobium pratense]|uniref:Iron-siderophore ABC transporter substrate-binding protein n=1 Tax=Ornithinimicrobium pratense TaxID=2593973 RepID=A0A5J6V9J8_9MICO|nr:iron-siderophore ABC transporter substrate-binding protein [Ornithinimicrobium pratense]QFG69851.1 iron-siderophore ABC transporter substrate-binding protein [Ornithinimicrobium pratense]
MFKTHRAALTATALAAALLLAACGEGTNSGTDTGPADDTGSGPSGGGARSADADAFPVTVQHAFGETTIEQAPERVATVAWANHEVPLALGIVPVGMGKATWGDDDGDGILPWVEDKLAELGAEPPVLFDETDGIDFEAVADTSPDVILAAYSGLTQEQYDTLSKIAPVVAYPDLAWGTTMTEMIELNSQALGLAQEGEQLIADLDATIADAVAQYPQLEGQVAVFTYLDPNDLSQIDFYTTSDPRAGYLETLGLQAPAVVAEASAASDSFYETVSAESSDSFADVDLFVTYGATDGSVVELVQSDPLLSKIPAVANGAIVVLQDNTPLAASANPSPLAIAWGLEDYLALLAQAVDQAR